MKSIYKTSSFAAYLFVANILITSYSAIAQTKQYEDVVHRYAKDHHFNGALIITTRGKLVYQASAGIANRSDNSPVTQDTKFKIASITKTFTAVLILQLMEEGKLRLEDTIGKYLTHYTGEGKDKVTLYQLLTYSSGIPNPEGDSGMRVYQRRLPQDEFISRYCSGALHFTPGTQFEYNNADYILLGKIIETLTGHSFSQAIQERICQPLQMKKTGLLSDSNVVYRLASTYTYNDSKKQFYNDEPYSISAFGAAGAMYSTVEDMGKFDEGIFSYRLLKESSVQRMIHADTSLQNVGLGFWATDGYEPINTPFVYRPGGILGATANWIHLLKEDTAFILLSNTDATSLFGMTGDLYKVYMGRDK